MSHDELPMYCQSFLTASPCIMMIVDPKNRYIMGTDALIYKNLQFPEGEPLAGAPLGELFKNIATSGWIEGLLKKFEAVRERGTRLQWTDSLELNKGELLYLDIVLSPALDESGNAYGLVLLMHDVTELVMAREAALGASRGKSTFLANMSHEIRTPLNAIVGMSNLLSLTELNDVQKGYIQNQMAACDSLVSLINDILDFSKIDAEKIDIAPREYSLSDLLTDVSTSANLKATEKNIDFIVEMDPQLPSRLLGDELRIKQILSNLLTNAVQFTDKGHVQLKISGRAENEKLDIVFSVIDTGIGIAPERIKSMFNAFSHLGNNQRRPLQGTGLGLALSMGIAHAMGGEIAVLSTLGEGSTFSLTIPQKILSKRPVAAIDDASNKRALILGDDLQMRSILKMVEALFIPCDQAADAETLAALFDKRTYSHLFFADEESRDMVLRESSHLRNTRKAALINLQALSSKTPTPDVDLLIKPVLVHDVARILNLKSLTDSEKSVVPVLLTSVRADGVRALVVDDNEINLIVAEEVLSHYGMDVETAPSGKVAIELVRAHLYDIIFMDQMMPEMDGIETTQRIRAEGGFCEKVPIIALTANAVTGAQELFLQSGLNDYISKPIEIQELNRVLLKHLPDRCTTQAAEAERADHSIQAAHLKAIARSMDIQVAAAIRLVGGSEATYSIILETFMSSIGRRLNALDEYFKKGDIDNFRIEVHGQKSALFNIGAKAASEQARKLELAATNGNIDFIREHLSEYLDTLRLLDIGIRKCMPDFDAPSKVTYARKATLDDALALRRTLIDIAEAIEDLAPDRALQGLNAIARIDYGADVERELAAIRAAIDNFDYDQACELVAAVHYQ